MEKFIQKLFIFITPIIILAYPIDLLLNYLILNSNTIAQGELTTWKDIYNGNINSDIVIYGSSRAWVHINPQLIEIKTGLKSYNLGIDGYNFDMQYFRHKELLKYNKKPKQIIVSVDIFTLQRRKDLYNYQQFLPFMLNNDDYKKQLNKYSMFTSADYNLPLIRYIYKKDLFVKLIKDIVTESSPSRVKGYMGHNKKWNSDFEKAKNKNDSYTAEIDLRSVNLFENFIAECIKDKIKIVLVYTPEYIDGQHYVKNRTEIIDLFEKISQKYNIKYFDYSNDEICNNKNLFYNSTHLNKTGSEIFTTKLIEDIYNE
jgi:hypothetical protein